MVDENELEGLHEYYESRIGETEDLAPMQARVSKAPRHVFSLRIGAEELDAIAASAERRSVSVGDFIRQAALREATGQSPGSASEISRRLDELQACIAEILIKMEGGFVVQRFQEPTNLSVNVAMLEGQAPKVADRAGPKRRGSAEAKPPTA